MAVDLGNPFDKAPGRKKIGPRFEYDVREYLRRELPDDYVFRQGVVVTGAEKGRRGEVVREIDFVVAGPNGVFFLEAKSFDIIRGPINDVWEWWVVEGGMTRRVMRGGRPAEKMQNLLAKFKTVVESMKAGAPFRGDIHPFRYARPVFVFPSHAVIEVEPERDRRPGDYSPYRLVRLKDLARVIRSWAAPSGAQGRPLRREAAEAVITEVLIPGRHEEADVVGSYKVVERGAERRASNGLSYTMNLLRHFEMGSRAWGKRYDTTKLADRDREQFERQVKRHATVIARIRDRHVHHYYDSFLDPGDNSYWVIEEWIDGDTLRELLKRGGLAADGVPRLMAEVAEGLRALHAEGFVYRELNPEAILVERETGRVVLTNFEMARAPEGPTVAPSEYAHDPYRAPEWSAEPGSADVRADVYSWGGVFFHAAAGSPYDGENAGLLSPPPLSEELRSLVLSCLERDPSRRPSDMRVVLAALGRPGGA